MAAAVLQSYPEALKLGSLASILQVTRNPPDQSLLTGDRAPMSVGDATLRILGPLDAQIEDFRKEWHEKLGPTGAGPAALAQYLDELIPNLASIVALLHFGNPDRASLEMLEKGTGNRKINVYLTVAAQDCDAQHEAWRSNKTTKYDPAIHAIMPVIQRWQQGNRITVSNGAPIQIDF